ncbi:hypothetical protein LOK49_Contig424G00001 [Camellia lanceoleosa]|nr:hypothetical protein LOK49_Contig424G00001 [Camellia lanceoleosa]
MAEEVAQRLENISIMPKKEEDIVINEEELKLKAVTQCIFSLVGRLFTKKHYNMIAFKEAIRSAWDVSHEVGIVDVSDNLYHFRFGLEVLMNRVLVGGPWCFDNHLLLRRWHEEMVASNVVFEIVDLWVQMWGLPFEFLSLEIGNAIGRRIGEVMDVDRRAEEME